MTGYVKIMRKDIRTWKKNNSYITTSINHGRTKDHKLGIQINDTHCIYIVWYTKDKDGNVFITLDNYIYQFDTLKINWMLYIQTLILQYIKRKEFLEWINN